jgi:hypothetical protein
MSQEVEDDGEEGNRVEAWEKTTLSHNFLGETRPFFFFFNFLLVPEFELRTYHFSHASSP